MLYRISRGGDSRLESEPFGRFFSFLYHSKAREKPLFIGYLNIPFSKVYDALEKELVIPYWFFP